MHDFFFAAENRRFRLFSQCTEGSFSADLAGARAFVSHPFRWARHISRARKWATGVGVVAVQSDKGSGWLLRDRLAAAGVAVLAVAAVGPGTMLLLRLRGAGPCPPSRGHTTGAGRRVRGAGADADAAGPGPRRSIPSPAAF